MATTIDQRGTHQAAEQGADRPPERPATLPRRLTLGVLAGAVFAVALAVRHLVSDDPDVTWGDVGLRAAIIGGVVPLLAALVPTRWANSSWVARGRTTGQRLGLVLLCLGAVVLVAMRSYRWMAR